MAKYHKYVFDEQARRLIGDFEAMYAAEDDEGFDSWHSHDVRQLRLRLASAMLADYNFARVLEIGCGKGAAAQFLKRRNNRVLGVDLSPTAIAKAQATFPDIEFRCLDARDVASLGERFDLVAMQGVLAYIEPWRKLLCDVARMTQYCLVGEYIPPNPIGMVKSPGELIEAFTALFDIEHKLVLDDQIVIVFGRVRNDT
jgi:2-polyprenyl-3-methyl-5-hydroxy-6-metoxy-1,4-benzoquinol methylase